MMHPKKVDKLLKRVKDGFNIPESTVSMGRTTKRKWVSTEAVDALVKRKRTALARRDFRRSGVSVRARPPVEKETNAPEPSRQRNERTRPSPDELPNFFGASDVLFQGAWKILKILSTKSPLSTASCHVMVNRVVYGGRPEESGGGDEKQKRTRALGV